MLSSPPIGTSIRRRRSTTWTSAGNPGQELLHHRIADGNIDGLCAAWDRLGVLALSAQLAPGDRASSTDKSGKGSNTSPHSDFDSCWTLGCWPLCSGARIARPVAALRSKADSAAVGTVQDGATNACLEFPVARWPMMIQSTPTPDRRMRGQTLRLLIVVDPSGDLSGAGDEYRDLMQEFDSSSEASSGSKSQTLRTRRLNCARRWSAVTSSTSSAMRSVS